MHIDTTNKKEKYTAGVEPERPKKSELGSVRVGSIVKCWALGECGSSAVWFEIVREDNGIFTGVVIDSVAGICKIDDVAEIRRENISEVIYGSNGS